jgi:enoyl-CoA hydratase
MKNVLLEVKESIGIITLDNPPGNYLVEPEFLSARVLKSWIEDEKLKGILVCGTGRHFSAGASLDGLFVLASSGNEMSAQLDKGKETLRIIAELDIPVIAAIKGVCFGAGLEIALAAHIRICGSRSLFAFPESNQGLIPGLGGTARLSCATSFLQSARMILGGDMIDAREALEMKIVDRVVSDEQLPGDAFSHLVKMTEGRSLKVIRYVMQALHNAQNLSFAEAMKEETRMFCELAAEEAKRRSQEL